MESFETLLKEINGEDSKQRLKSILVKEYNAEVKHLKDIEDAQKCNLKRIISGQQDYLLLSTFSNKIRTKDVIEGIANLYKDLFGEDIEKELSNTKQ